MKRAILLLIAMALAAPATALMVEVPLERLAATSDVIVQARVTGLESRWTEDHATIVTDVTLVIGECWAGTFQPGDRLALQVEGGEVEDQGIWVEHQPVFRTDEEAVLFLRADPSARLHVNALEQGKFTVAGDQVLDFRQQAMPLRTLRALVISLRPQRGR